MNILYTLLSKILLIYLVHKAKLNEEKMNKIKSHLIQLTLKWPNQLAIFFCSRWGILIPYGAFYVVAFNSSGCYQNWFTWLYLLPCLFRDHLSWPNIEEECIFFIGPMWSCTFYIGGWTQTTRGLNDNIVAMIWCVANCHRPNQSHAKRWLGCIFKGKKENCHESLR